MKTADVLNILLPINQTFIKLAWEQFNPRNAMYISRNDGYFNSDVSMQRDTLINANTLARLGRDTYTPEDIAKRKRDINAVANQAGVNPREYKMAGTLSHLYVENFTLVE